MAKTSGIIELRLFFKLIIILLVVGLSQSENSIRQQRLFNHQQIEKISSKHHMTRVSKWYLKWLALQRKKSSLQPKQRPEVQNIQSDVPGCRDDLCIAEEVEPDYSDEKNPKESPKLNPRDVICPHGFVPIVRDRIIYCDITQLSTEKVTENVICADNEKKIITNEGTKCLQEGHVVSTPSFPTKKTKENGTDCISGHKGNPDNVGRCMDIDSSNSSQVRNPQSMSPLDAKRSQNKNVTVCKTGEIMKNVANGKICVVKETLERGPKHADFTPVPAVLASPDPTTLITSPVGQETSLTERSTHLSQNSHLQPHIEESDHPLEGKKRNFSYPIDGKHVPVFKRNIPLFNIPGLADKLSGKKKKSEMTRLLGTIPKIDIGRLNQGKKLPCEEGKVLVVTPNGSICIDPVFPEGVCPPDRVPYLSSVGIQCLPCPFGQNVAKVDRGIKCVSLLMDTTMTPERPTEEICPDGLLPFGTPGGRVCRFTVPQPAPTETVTCNSEEEALMVDGKLLCQTKILDCPSGQVLLKTETGKTVCGFDVPVQRKKCDEKIDDDCLLTKIGQNVCPPGQEMLRLHTGEITCKYIFMKQSQPPIVEFSFCIPGEILTHNHRGFICQPEENVGNHRPVCSSGLIVARFGPNYDCITASKAHLLCQEHEKLVRHDAGFVCVELKDSSVVTPVCAPDKVVFSDQNGHVQCLSLMEAGALCGDRMIAVKSGAGFICKHHHLDLNCPQGYQFRLVRGIPTCVSASEPDCIEIQGNLSTLCLNDLKKPNQLDIDLNFDNVFEPPIICGEGQITSIVDGKVICTETSGKLPGQEPCEADGVRPCDLDPSILLEGCNPDCANGGTCVDGKCLCPTGITGIACSEDINECLSLDDSVCEHQCENIFGGYNCVCPAGMILGGDGHSCQDIGCTPDCLNGGQCVRGVCQCRRGFEGKYCQTDKDECSRYGDRLCQYYCRNTYGGYQCICPPGSRLNVDQRTCINTTCIPECRNGGSCENHRCFCPPGFYGFVCQLDINECYKFDPCQHDCVNTWGSFKCLCEDGYRLASDGHTCIR